MKRPEKPIAASLCLALCLMLCACTASGSGRTTELTTGENKLTLTVFVDATTLDNEWAMALSAKFSQYKLEFVSQTAGDSRSEIARQIAHKDTPDLIISNYLSKDLEGIGTSLADLSGKSYISGYKTTYLSDASMDGKIYFLPIAQRLDGIIYNKTLFDERGWSVPTDYAQYQALCQAASAAGYGTTSQIEASSQLAARFMRAYDLDMGRNLSTYRWMTRFNNRQGTLAEQDFTSVFNDLDLSRSLIANRSPDERSVSYMYRLVERQYAMVEGNDISPRVVNAGGRDEFRLMPYFGSQSDGGWLISSGMTSVAASASAMSDTKKRAAIDTIIGFLSSEDGQAFIRQYTNSAVSPVTGTLDTTSDTYYADVQGTISNGRILNLDRFPHCEEAMKTSLTAYFQGLMTREQVIAAMDSANQEPDPDEIVVTHASGTFDFQSMSSLVLTAMREQMGTDFSLLCQDVKGSHVGNIPNARRSISGVFYKGDITESDVNCCIVPQYYAASADNRTTTMEVVTLTGAQLLELMAYDKGLYWAGGLKMIYTWNTDQKTWVATGFTADNGRAFDASATYTVATNTQIGLDAGTYQKVTASDVSYQETVKAWLKKQKTISPGKLPEAIYRR